METKKALSRKAIEQLCYVKDVNSLAVLSGEECTLSNLSSYRLFEPQTQL